MINIDTKLTACFESPIAVDCVLSLFISRLYASFGTHKSYKVNDQKVTKNPGETSSQTFSG